MNDDSTSKKRIRLSMREFFALKFKRHWMKQQQFLKSSSLFQQFLVDAYTMIDRLVSDLGRMGQTSRVLYFKNYVVLNLNIKK